MILPYEPNAAGQPAANDARDILLCHSAVATSYSLAQSPPPKAAVI